MFAYRFRRFGMFLAMTMTIRRLWAACLATAVVLGAGLIIRAWWNSLVSQQQLLAAAHVSVIGLNDSFPPALTIDFENVGDAIIGQTHFRLVFEVDGGQISRADEDHGNFKPGEKRRMILQSRSAKASPSLKSYPVYAKYTLIVIPGWGKQLPAISGGFLLRK
jgi:hypothetical protein